MPSLASLASPEDLRESPGVSVSLDDVEAWAALGRAERAIIADLHWPLWEYTRTVTEYGPLIVLPAPHVTAVSVSVGAVVQASSWFTWTSPSQIVKLPSWRCGPVVITYTAGFTAATMPGVIKDACVKAAVEDLRGGASNLKAFTNEGGVSETYDTSIAGYSIETDRRLDAYRLTAAVA